MVDLIVELVQKLATTLSLVPAVDIYGYEIPEGCTAKVLVQEEESKTGFCSQIDAERHIIKVTACDKTNAGAKALALRCQNVFITDDAIVDTTNLSLLVEMPSAPIWERTDQNGRKYFYFKMIIISKRLN